MAITDDNLWVAERRLWTEGAESYDELVAADCLMVFPGTGMLGRGGAMAAQRGQSPWTTVDMADMTVARFGKDVAVLAYRASATRENGETFSCHCTSTYRGADAGWHLIQHQQTVNA